MTSTMEAPRSGAVTMEEREVTLAAPAHDLAPRIISREPGDFAVPGPRDEEWRFTPLRRLRGLHDGSALAAGADVLDLTWSTMGAAAVEVVDHTDPRVGAWYTPTDRVAAETFAAAKRAVVVSIAREAEQASASLTLAGVAERSQVGHVVVEVGANAHATVALDHVGAADAAVGTIVEVHVGQGAQLTLVSYHGWDDTAAHVGHLHTVLDADASLRSVVVTLGGDVVRHSASVEYRGRGGNVELVGVYFADAGQHQEHRLFVDHSVPDCHSDVIYKGALQGEGAHTVWIGDVLIRAAASGTKTFELNRNLVLTEGARADSVPNLEIETGQILRAPGTPARPGGSTTSSCST